MVKDKITYKAEKTDAGDILVIYRGDEPIGNLRQVGRGKSPDVELRSSYMEKPMRFPMVGLRDISQRGVEKIVEKYIIKPKTAMSKVVKLPEQIDKLEGVEKTIWDGRTSKLTVYYDEQFTKDQMNVRVQAYLTANRLRDSVEEITFISTPKGTFKPPAVEKAKAVKGKAEAEYKELMKPRLEAHDSEIKAVNDDFMAGKMSSKEMDKKHKAIHKKTDMVAATMRRRVWGEYPETLPSRAELEKIQRMRTSRSQASDLARQHSVLISTGNPKVAKWLHDQGTADIEGIDTPPKGRRRPKISQRTPRITPRTGRLR